MLTELAENQWRGELRFVSAGCRVRRRRRHRPRPRPRPRPRRCRRSVLSFVRSFVRSFVHRQTFYDQPTRSTPHPCYRCARSRSINALRRFHGGGKTETEIRRLRNTEKERENTRNGEGSPNRRVKYGPRR